MLIFIGLIILWREKRVNEEKAGADSAFYPLEKILKE